MENDHTASTSSDTKNSDYQNEFYNTSRIGRRNALPDILGYNPCTTTTADLPERLSALTTNDKDDGTIATTSGTSFINRDQPSTSQACISNSQTAGTSTGTSSNNAMNNT